MDHRRDNRAGKAKSLFDAHEQNVLMQRTVSPGANTFCARQHAVGNEILPRMSTPAQVNNKAPETYESTDGFNASPSVEGNESDWHRSTEQCNSIEELQHELDEEWAEPPFTPPEQIDYNAATTILAVPEEPNPEMLCLSITSGRQFVFTQQDLQRGGPHNFLLAAYHKACKEGRINPGQCLKHERDDPDGEFERQMEIVHSYCKGEDVIPLSPKRSISLCGQYPPPRALYDKLYKTAQRWGFHGLMVQIRDQARREERGGTPEAERFRLYTDHYDCPVYDREIRGFISQIKKTLPVPEDCRNLRGVIIGAAINFSAHLDERSSASLNFCLQFPATPLSRTFCRLIDCQSDVDDTACLLEGTLSEEECRGVPFGIIYANPVQAQQDEAPQHDARIYTLEDILSVLHPASDTEGPPLFDDTFCRESWKYSKRNAVRDDHPSSRYGTSPDRSLAIKRGPGYLRLPYATVVARFQMPETVPGIPKFTLELVRTATLEILGLEPPSRF